VAVPSLALSLDPSLDSSFFSGWSGHASTWAHRLARESLGTATSIRTRSTITTGAVIIIIPVAATTNTDPAAEEGDPRVCLYLPLSWSLMTASITRLTVTIHGGAVGVMHTTTLKMCLAEGDRVENIEAGNIQAADSMKRT